MAKKETIVSFRW